MPTAASWPVQFIVDYQQNTGSVSSVVSSQQKIRSGPPAAACGVVLMPIFNGKCPAFLFTVQLSARKKFKSLR
jgi:hypothetical protein